MSTGKLNVTNEPAKFLLEEFYVKAERLQRILEKETEYFRRMKMKRAENLFGAKENLIDDLKGLKEQISLIKDHLKSLPEEEKDKIRELEASLTSAAEQNLKEAFKAREVNKLIVEAIADAVSRQQSEMRYGEGGNFETYSYGNSPLTINQSA
jgi:hypothetical protein